ncbi:MAG: isocitrate/isopropylmalate family dehydrogenase [Chloroflexota bacterium]
MPQLCVMPGDGIGQEVIPAAVEVLKATVADLEVVEGAAGWSTFEETGFSVPDETLDKIRTCRAGLFGAVQSPMRKVQGYRSAILTMRQDLDLYANIRPVRSWPQVSPREGLDIIVIRENTEGLYIGRERSDGETAVAERQITAHASKRIGQKAVEILDMLDRNRLTIVHKVNVLPLTDGLFRDCVREIVETEVKKDVVIDELLIDVAALKMVGEPERFDVAITTNLFGDILSDAAAHWGGGLGFAPSLNWGDDIAVAEPVHGSAPDIYGQGLANPIAAVLSAALLVRYVWQRPEVAAKIENAVEQVLASPLPKANVTRAVTNALLAAL